jgi:Cytochrome c bacterial
MKIAGLPFSNKVTFIKTEMNWPLNHMVSAKESSLKCNDCHTRENGRLAGLTDFYMPGRDRSEWVDLLGTIALILSLLGVLGHGLLRIFFSQSKRLRG